MAEPEDRDLEALLRELAPRVLGAVLRRSGDFDRTEDAVQEALLAASRQWPAEGVPTNPHGWLVTVASRRLTDQWRSEAARRDREANAAAMEPARETTEADGPIQPAADDALRLLLLCCHPALSMASQVALTLRAVAGLTTAQIASAFLVPEATMTRRITRAKRSIEAAGARFGPPPGGDYADRLNAVLHTLYLIFNEGYTTTGGDQLHRVELTSEAIRLTRQILRLLPEDGEVAGLLALMLLTEARRPARATEDGALVPLAEQDRDRWDAALLREGIELITATLPRSRVGPYQLQAAIAAVHAEAGRAEDTDWPQIVALYQLLERRSASPMVILSHAVAVAMVDGPRAGLELIAPLETDERMAGHHRLTAVRAHLLEMAGEHAAARIAYQLAARQTTSRPERRYLATRAAQLPAR
ncbi:MAG TPA: sigma-70 family RNA polymerase sigma factor [Pseudonocardia sp.]|uniref:RNA polymerase sigma factor n=1 Tax=Pseudonocardia sp. TaxID=60912 RepID=UPI002BF02948|nr:sigma-70 family RNA polymerase sigma factor [Pseudonocardia sp.]HTF54954.1 sigma-70 family RNA polymerase sigma factor [Pseudonocardia sp.]